MIDEHRAIRVATSHTGSVIRVRAAIEDRFHNFRIEARLADGRIESVEVDPIRFPYTLCPAAGERVALLAGAPASGRMSDHAALLDARHQCTHQFDAACVALALAVRGVAQRVYRCHVWGTENQVHGRITADDVELLSMRVEGDVIVAPQHMAGRLLGPGFTGWTAHALDEEAAEAALLLRRMIFIGRDSRYAERYENEPNAPAFRGCWVQQPERNTIATRLRGKVLSPNTDPGMLTHGDERFVSALHNLSDQRYIDPPSTGSPPASPPHQE